MPSLPGSWGRSASWSGQWHICQKSLGLGYLSAMMILQQLLTWDDYVLSLSARSSKMAKEGAARKHLIARSGKLVRNANVNFSSSRPTAITCPIDKQDHFNDDILAIVNCDPGMFVCFCGAQCACLSVNAFVSCMARPIGWLGGSHRLQLINMSCKCNAR